MDIHMTWTIVIWEVVMDRVGEAETLVSWEIGAPGVEVHPIVVNGTGDIGGLGAILAVDPVPIAVAGIVVIGIVTVDDMMTADGGMMTTVVEAPLVATGAKVEAAPVSVTVLCHQTAAGPMMMLVTFLMILMQKGASVGASAPMTAKLLIIRRRRGRGKTLVAGAMEEAAAGIMEVVDASGVRVVVAVRSRQRDVVAVGADHEKDTEWLLSPSFAIACEE